MILVCPACQTRYKVEDEAVSRPSGRTVRCANCGHGWHHIAPAAAPTVAPDPLLRLRERLQAPSSPEKAAEPRPAITAPSPPSRHRQRSGLGWVILILVIGVVIVGAIFGRDQIVVRWPQAARFYEMVGLKIQPLGAGLEIAHVTSTRNADGLIVEGDVTNRVETMRDVPRLRVALRDGSQHELVFKIIEPPRERLLPGETSHFVVGFLPAPDAAAGVVVTFAAG